MVLPGQVFRHYKNPLYRILCIATHTETLIPRTQTLQKLVVYASLTEPSKVWARPYDMFVGHETINGKIVQRFTLVKIHNV
jgi:hypothetical protein